MQNDELTRYPYLVFGNGETLPGTMAQDGSTLWIWLDEEIPDNQAFLEIVQKFADPEVTGNITCHTSDKYSFSCDGFTHLTDVGVDYETLNPKIRLRDR